MFQQSKQTQVIDKLESFVKNLDFHFKNLTLWTHNLDYSLENMSVYDKNSPMNDILVRGEEARRRRSKKRRVIPDEMAADSNVLLRNREDITATQEMAYSNWLMEMISYPCQKTLSKLEHFTMISAILVYLPVNFFLLFNPLESCKQILVNATLQECIKSQGLVRFIGIQVYSLVFLYVIFCRASSRLPASGIILGTFLSRTVYALTVSFLLYLRKYITIQLIYNIMIIDGGLTVVSMVFWVIEPKGETTKSFFGSIWQLVKPSNQLSLRSSVVVQILGFVQSILSLTCLVFPKLAFGILKISAKEITVNMMGAYAMCLMPCAAIGFVHVLSGGADSRSFNIAAVFYRVFFTMPLMALVGATHQTPLGMTLYFIVLDGVFSLIVFVSLCFESKKEKKQYCKYE